MAHSHQQNNPSSLTKNQTVSWSAPEYAEGARPFGWYAALTGGGIISALLAAYFGNFLLSFILVLGAGVFILFSLRHPETINYKLSSKGLQINQRLYPFEQLETFWVHEKDPPFLVIESKRAFMQTLTIPIPEDATDEIKLILLHFVEEEHREPPYSEQIARSLGF